jgi:antitoxin MazE
VSKKINRNDSDESNTADKTEEERHESRKAVLERLASLNWTLPADYKFDRDDANKRRALRRQPAPKI